MPEIPVEKGEVVDKAKKVPATHEVRENDTLSRIALHYGVTVGDLLEANELKSSVLRTGTRLKLPAKSRTKK